LRSVPRGGSSGRAAARTPASSPSMDSRRTRCRGRARSSSRAAQGWPAAQCRHAATTERNITSLSSPWNCAVFAHSTPARPGLKTRGGDSPAAIVSSTFAG
jgi:hypothetical protein